MLETTRATVLRGDQRDRWGRGERPAVEVYLERHPGLLADPEGMLDLIYNEVVLREQVGDTPRLDEYLRRFPDFASQLRVQFEVHAAVRSGGAATPFPVARSGSIASPREGTVVGEFRVVRLLGQGAMGQVFLAEQPSLKRPVALKMLRADLPADPTFPRRFQAEGEALARVAHPNIVQVYAVGEWQGRRYMALEYVKGCNLADHLARAGKLELLPGLRVLRQVASALQRAGEEGIVHRDVKPANILLSGAGDVKVGDFGLCSSPAAERRPRLTQSGVALGTPIYMSPEQIQCHPVDARSDIYSLGVTAYHLFAGRPPFRGESSLEVALQHVHGEATPLSQERPDLPGEVCALVHRMMARRPEDRFASAREVLDEINRLRAAHSTARLKVSPLPPELPAAGASPSPVPVLPPRGQQHRRVRRLVAATLLLLLAGSAAGWLACRHDEHHADAPHTSPEPSAVQPGTDGDAEKGPPSPESETPAAGHQDPTVRVEDHPDDGRRRGRKGRGK